MCGLKAHVNCTVSIATCSKIVTIGLFEGN